MNNFEIKPANAETAQAGRSRRLAGRKIERSEVEELRLRVAALEAENRNLYEQAFLLQQRLETTGATEKERATFISTVAHELRTPLTSIKGYIDLVLEGETGEINEVQREFLSIVGVNANKLASIIGDLLDVSRLETGRIVFKPFLVELVSLCQALTDSVRPQFEAKGITFKPSIPLGGHLEMMADRDRLLQALRAILAQAGLYTAQGGSVGFTLNRGFMPNVAEIVISDDGPEIALEDLPKVFTKFFRPSFSDTEINSKPAVGSVTELTDEEQVSNSTGLGLAIAKAIIEMHQGDVRVESEEGLGNRFILTLPLLTNSDSEKEAEFLMSTSPSVLVVSRDTGFVQTLETLLKSEGFQVVVAQEREEVVAETPAWQPDLIIENSQELIPAQTLDVERRTPILSLSLSEMEQRALRAGALGVFGWPADEARLKLELLQMLAPDLEGAALEDFIAAQKVLLVSPQTELLRVFDKLLHDFGHKRVYRATMEADALALARRHRPTLLMLVVGPEVSSIELFEELYSDPLLHTTPAVIFTTPENIAVGTLPQYQTGSNFDESSVISDGNKGATLNTLPKPLTRRRLVSVVQRLAVTVQL